MPKAQGPAPRQQATPPASGGTPPHPAPQGPIPGDEVSGAIAFTAAAIKHFDDRSDLSTINGMEFLQMAEEAGLMARVKYEPKKHAYLKQYADSRNVKPGDEILALSDAGQAVLDEAEKSRADAEKAAAAEAAKKGKADANAS